MVDRRAFLCWSVAVLAGALAVDSHAVDKVARIGLLAIGYREFERQKMEVFWEPMRERGWVKGQNILVEERWAEGKIERLGTLAMDLVRLKVDLIAAVGQAAALAARNATTTVPIAMIAFDDPVRSGLVASLAHPGGNVTGLTFISDEHIIGKQLQLLTEVVRGLSSVALLKDPVDPRAAPVLAEMQGATRSLQLRLQVVDVGGPDQLDGAFAAISRDRVGAVLVQPSGMFYSHLTRLVTIAAKYRLPAIFWRRDWVEAGALMSYGGADYLDLLRRWRRTSTRSSRAPSQRDLPVEQPTKFELVINLKTAKALGLTIPPSLLARADQVIE